MAALEAQLKASLPQLCEAFLRQKHATWSATKTQAEIDHFCATTLAFAAHCNLTSVASIDILLEQRVLGRMSAPFSEWQKMLLTRPGRTEESRLSEFLETLSSKDQPILINLNTDLDALKL